MEQFIGIGMGAPGPITDGVIKTAVNIGWENYPLKQKLEETFSLPAYVTNDANCAALGELWHGAGKGLENIVCITLGTGVGGGIIIEGNIVSGITGGAGELGHIPVLDDRGYMCNCGKKGCLETVASATGIVRLATEMIQQKEEMESQLYTLYEQTGEITSKHVFDLAREKYPLALKVVDKVAEYLGLAFGGISSILNPEAIIVGGGVSNAGDTLLNPVKTYFNKFAFPAPAGDTKILKAELGNDAGAYGAAYLMKMNDTRY